MTEMNIASARRRPNPAFWSGRRVLLTGHTGFKGSWAALFLSSLGAKVTGVALRSEHANSLFELAKVNDVLQSHIIDIRDRDALLKLSTDHQFDVVLHLAAQPIVRASISDPVGTFATNVMGTVHVLDALRLQSGLQTVLVITTDKVYANSENGRFFVESDPLGGKDPYAASKSAAELVTASFSQSYFDRRGIRVATARGGNVIGGGDFSRDRLVADLIRSVQAHEKPKLRHPEATRPWQHVLDCIAGYLVYVECLCENKDLPRSLNFGPKPGTPAISVAFIAEAALRSAGWQDGWEHVPDPASIEASSLAIDASLARDTLGFESAIAGEEAIELTMEWHAKVRAGRCAQATTLDQIETYESR